MKLAAIHLSRVTYLVETIDLIAVGKIFLPDLVNAIAQRCEFRKFPENFGKDKDKGPSGAVFELGKWEDQPIAKLTIFTDGIVLETVSTTEDTETTLLALLSWAKESLGLSFEPEMVKRKIFVSQLAFYSDMQLDSLHPICAGIAETLSVANTKLFDQPFVFRTSAITFATSTLAGKFTPGIFSVERRVDVPDSENKYFSSAPLPTAEHLALLEEFEKAIKK
jgi:hypothetical protein